MITSAQLKPAVIDAAAVIRRQYDDFRTLNTMFMGVWRTGEIDKVWSEYRATDKRVWLTYFIRARGMGDIKIGKSNHVRVRLQSLFTGASRGVDLIACYPAPIRHETELHAEFEHLRLCGEWFRPGQELLTHLELVGCDTSAFTNVVPAHFYRRFPERLS
jgi:hypothetical protein